jgi:monoamine oxidase
MTQPDVIIIGAGAAGIGAGLELQARGVTFEIVEAADRIGGRAFTDTASLPRPWDQGCHWLHSADINPLVAWADRLGASYAKESRVDYFRMWQAGAWLDDDTARTARAATNAAFAAIYETAEAGRDVPIADILRNDARWDAGVRMMLQLMSSDDPERVSALGYGDYTDTEVNWPVLSGYGALIEAMAAGLPVRTGLPVQAVSETASGVRVETAQGNRDARAAIVAVSTNVLRDEALRIGPGAARDALDLIENVPCGAYEKIALALDTAIEADPDKLFCTIDPGDGAPAMNIQIRHGDPQLMIVHVGGDLARDAVRDGADGMVALATDYLARAYGNAIRGHIAGVATTGWQANPWIRGAYSYARPGTARDRHRLIETDTGAIRFAGEAFSRHAQSTAHGAYLSGRDVAAAIADRLTA